jgi:hypothetical protein
MATEPSAAGAARDLEFIRDVVARTDRRVDPHAFHWVQFMFRNARSSRVDSRASGYQEIFGLRQKRVYQEGRRSYESGD